VNSKSFGGGPVTAVVSLLDGAEVLSMFEWIRNLFRRSDDDERQRIIDWILSFKAEEPTRVHRELGTLQVPSGVLTIGDPQYVPDVEVSNIMEQQISISASLLEYPNGGVRVAGLKISVGGDVITSRGRKIGCLGIDSAKVVVGDKADIERFWTETGPDRIGEISLAPDTKVLKLLQKRFRFDVVQTNIVTAQIVDPVSEALEEEITNYLKRFRKYRQFPYSWFTVRTNNSFERVNYMDDPWNFMPIGNGSFPMMFACFTGLGDGVYDVYCDYSAESPSVISVSFIDEDSEETS
jgi:hypothetical protein